MNLLHLLRNKVINGIHKYFPEWLAPSNCLEHKMFIVEFTLKILILKTLKWTTQELKIPVRRKVPEKTASGRKLKILSNR